ncbi:MAG: chemotaxis protein MotB [Proteobacteria bacterium]|nr:chemotaxis protein MotB [Pseudomonadota bacterium]
MIERTSSARTQSRSTWLVIFTDLVALLLTFFVMLFSMSNIQIDKWTEMIDTLTRTLNPAQTKVAKIPSAKFNIVTEVQRNAINLNYLVSVVGEKIKDDPFLAQARLVALDDRVVLSFPGVLLFEGASASLRGGSSQALFNLSGILQLVENQIGINSYVAPGTATGAGSYTSDWELSLARGAAVANEIRRAGYEAPVLAFGYGSARTPQLRELPGSLQRSLAQRIDIVILSNRSTR